MAAQKHQNLERLGSAETPNLRHKSAFVVVVSSSAFEPDCATNGQLFGSVVLMSNDDDDDDDDDDDITTFLGRLDEHQNNTTKQLNQ